MDSAERAARAVREFRHMVPGLSAYAQTITGDPKVRVRPHAMTSTDGKWVNIRPPLILADRADHDRRLCDKRNEIGALTCPACARSEAVYACLYHEMSHIVSGSLKPNTKSRTLKAIERGLKGVPDSTRDYIKAALNDSEFPTGSYFSIYEAANKVHPYLVSVLRATDDYVIESNAVVARPGVEEMLYYMQEQIMLLGMENDDGTRVMWSEQPTEVQLPIALLVELHGWGLDGKFSDVVKDIIRSDSIQSLIKREIPDVLTGLSAAVGFLGEFNRLGYLLAPDQENEPTPEPEPEESEESDDDEPESGESNSDDADDSGQGSGGGGSDNEDSGEEDSDSAGQPDDAGNAGPGAGDDSVSESKAGEAANDDVEDGADSESGGKPGDGHSSDGVDGNDSESGQGGNNLRDNSGGNSNSDNEEIQDGEVSDDDTQDNSEPGDTDSGNSSQPAVGDPDSAGDAGDGTGNGFGGCVAPAPGDEHEPSDSGPESGESDSTGSKVTPEEIDRAMSQATGHEQNEKIMEEGYEETGEPTHGAEDDEVNHGEETGPATVSQDDLEIAIVQAMFFDDMSRTVGRVQIFTTDGPALGTGARWNPASESSISGSTNRARRVFSDNSLDKHVNNLRSGKLSARSLGARGWGDDKRVFRKKIRANKTDYFVTIGMDISGSTQGAEINRIKRAGYAMAELLSRVGVDFCIYGHSTSGWDDDVMDQHIYEIKSPEGMWDKGARERLSRLNSSMGSLDGHNFEFYRKRCMESDATKKMVVYYTDGYIPETNHEDEAYIMERESRLYKRFDIESLIVAVGTELRDAYGFDQVQLDDEEDIKTVLAALETKLTRSTARA